MRRLRFFLLALCLACVAGAAPAQSTAAAEAAPEKRFELTLTGASVLASQRMIRVTKGDRIVLRISGDAPGQFHLHAYQVDAKVVPGQTTEVAFVANATGRFRFQWHPAQPSAADNHTAPLATLEVHPQ